MDYSRAFPLAGETVLVTGAGRGLGLAISRAVAASGARVIVTGRSAVEMERVAESLRDMSYEVRAAVVDVSVESSVNELVNELADESVSVLINNAGVAGPVAPITSISSREWNDVFDTNVRGVFHMCRAFLPPMMALKTGQIINIASVTGKRALARRTPYASSKMAVIGLTVTLAHEVGPFGISVNSLSPGPVDGPRMDKNFQLEAELTGCNPSDARQKFVSSAAFGRMVTSDEVAQAVIAILGMKGLTGADIDLSAGMSAR